MANKLNVDGVLLLEQPFARVPYENYRKIFRTSQKYIEKELGALQATSAEFVKNNAAASVRMGDVEESVKTIECMIGRVENLKRKLSNLQETAARPTQDVMRERLQHLATIDAAPSSCSPDFSRWAETRLDRWLVDWSLRNGKEKTARQLAKEKDIETLVDIDLFTDIRRIEEALRHHSCTEALAWCNENKASLRKMKASFLPPPPSSLTLEFDLRLQEYIELTRARKSMEAISYAKRHLVQWQETHYNEILHANALIAFDPSTTCLPYKRLFDPSRWSTLIQSFRQTAYSLNTLPTEPLLNLALYAGLASLKTPACYDPSTKNVDCPVCDGETRDAGIGSHHGEVPLSHHENSTIVCRISGKIMDDVNMPMAFPDGQVYSREALEEMAARDGGIVTCPRSGNKCEFSALRKVFIS
ncbi:hypothetical protein AMATHDRAFT_147869 [Amanita thiersii Skay4041]|uniref:CTLH domain-containing protein n=1 Tax=Amanita thiersii Skay4041 TaxID=703135 RepID=A0A2A9NH10_9AGAR|nr:hypothetical protein AMATHDRAFT_147869 [Amanita thiersii Skay4041]